MIGITLATALLATPAEPATVPAAEVRPALVLPSDLLERPTPVPWKVEPRRERQASAPRKSSTAVKVLGTALGAAGGFYAGGMIGFYTAQDRDADDDGVSGLRGVVIGAPIGAAIGAILGYQIAK